MKKRLFSFLRTISVLLASLGVVMTEAAAADLENTLYMDLPYGRVVIEMRPDLAPKHVERIKTLTRQGFYNGTPFHRVIDGFMVQGGDPTGTGRGGSDLPDLPAEFSPSSKARHVRGVLSMARTSNPNSANSQFFIMLAPATHLDGQYSIWGQVVEGMDLVDRIKKGDPRANGSVTDPDRIVKMQVAADVKE
ncbi:peptidyl-prolyl cis-trans isomerase [Pararhodospirillum oryzae]|uniref:Peptidyl-prolyl cis-trans isomerase n=2 Tax=Pararhodospirillum oryzae TaxID=478448 RepID=A0A512HB52_9PROT|nr:peptidyl-prolyl cis-trans isomerase [Pararhodospirillum oryzae]